MILIDFRTQVNHTKQPEMIIQVYDTLCKCNLPVYMLFNFPLMINLILFLQQYKQNALQPSL